jgi:Hint-domain
MKQGWGNKTQQRTADSVRNNLAQVIKVGRMRPVPLTGFQATSSLMTRGAQIGFQVTSLQGVDSFVLLRNFSSDPGSAQQIHVWPAASLQATPQTYPINLQYTDADPSIAGQKAYYWIKAVPVSNQTTSNSFLSGPQLFDASQQPSAPAITADYPVCQAYTPTTQPLSAATGAGANQATITVAAFQIQYPFDLDGDGDADLISYAMGALTPLLDSTMYFVYFNDPTYAGGPQTYIASTSNPDVTAGLYRQYVGNITTPAHGGGGTSGQGGGGGGGGAPCFSGNTKVVTKRGAIPISEIQPGDRIYSHMGWREVKQVLVHDYDGEMREMGSGELVTPTHRMRRERGLWVPAREKFAVVVPFKGKVFNLVLGPSKSDEAACYLLNNGNYAHNMRKF